VRAWKGDDNLLVSVADTGCGIAAEDLSKLFRPFQQVDGSIRRRYSGTGLGLSISKQFIELHGGKIWVESQIGVGTTFTFQIPLSPPLPVGEGFLHGLNPDWEYQQRTHPAVMPKVVVRPRFVVLETGNALQRLVTRYVEGVEVVPVADLEAAIDELTRAPTQALLVNDVSVSRALERISSSGRLPGDMPTIVCSVPGRQEAAGALGVAERLVKPVSRQLLLEALERLRIDTGTILIVDDEPDALHLFGRMLASAGRNYRVLLARDGQEALSIISDLVPDVILLDLTMSNMNGFQFLEVKSQDAALRDIPVIVISARDPAGQPIVSSAMAVTRGEGLSAHQLLAGIQAVSKVFSSPTRSGDLAPTTEPVG
jgi:CheY-like chemotaxis protein